MFFEHRLGPGPSTPSATTTLQALDMHGTRRMSAIRARRGSVGARRFSGLGMAHTTVSDFDGGAQRASCNEGEGEVAPDSTVGTGNGAGGGAVPVEETAGHFFAGFGEGLSTKSPVVYFAKTKHTGGDDCKAPINPYQASFLFLQRLSFCLPMQEVYFGLYSWPLLSTP